ncbi:MAG TPA: histone deacetylase [Chthoniobacteraceae bacterium]
MTILHDERSTGYATAGHPERPERVSRTAEHLRRAHPLWPWQTPPPAEREAILRAHSERQLARVEAGEHFDADTPSYDGIFEHAARAAGAAIECARLAVRGQRAFSLMRPPGHHATRDKAMGFCYLNSVAIAALDAVNSGIARVSIWDFDAHHGNGTEAICAGNDQVRYVSFHEHPAYPGTGSHSRGNCFNFPISAESPRSRQVATLRHTWGCVLEFAPQLILVSAGFDGYVRDPLCSLSLEVEDYGSCGKWISESAIPCGAILEGGYSDDLPLLIDAFLSAWDSRPLDRV